MTETKKIRKKKPKKLSAEQIMSLVVDEDLLKENKSQRAKQNVSKESDNEPKQEAKKTWFDNLSKKDFIKKEKDGKFYARHIKWKSFIWIGAYGSEKELDAVINSYVKEVKKPPIERDIKNIHSIVSTEI